MKKRFLWVLSLILALVCVIGIVGCKGGGEEEPEKKRIPYEGTYKVSMVTFSYQGSDYTVNLGGSFLSIFKLTEDLAVLTVKEGGTLDFNADLFGLFKFNVTGTWTANEEDEKKIDAVISGETITATCDGETLIIVYNGVAFTMVKK